MSNRWDIWKPSKNHPHWLPDEQTYAVKPPGYYNSDIFDKVDEAISLSSYEALQAELASAKARAESCRVKLAKALEWIDMSPAKDTPEFKHARAALEKGDGE